MKHFALLAAAILCFSVASGREKPAGTAVNVNFTTEGLYNTTTDKANWINLLNVQLDQRLWRNATLTVDLLSVYNLRDSKDMGGIADDLDIFSAIEDESIDLSLFMFGLTQRIGPVTLFAGVRNVNNDYFTSPWNSVFTGSTNGLLPIISHDYPLSDSPLSALCFHVEWDIVKALKLKNSLYNGVAGRGWDERFRFRPGRDGILNITELSYTNEEQTGYAGNYHLGAVYGNVREEESGVKQSSYSFWTLLEQPLYRGHSSRALELLLQGGYSPHCVCDRYAGAGLVWRSVFGKKDYAGALVNRTWHDAGNETALEFTYSFTLGSLTVQPAIHQIFAVRNQTIAMLKLSFDFSFEH